MRITEHPILGETNKGRLVTFDFDGKVFEGYEGEPIAAALRAAGVLVHRHTKKGSPRGIFCAIGRCTDCVMVVDGKPNVRTCVIETIIFVSVVYFATLITPDFAAIKDTDVAFFEIALTVGGSAFQTFITLIIIFTGLASALAGQIAASRLLFGFICVNLSVIVHCFIKNKEMNIIRNLIFPILGAFICFYIWINLSSIAKIVGFTWMAVGILYLSIRILVSKDFKVLLENVEVNV